MFKIRFLMSLIEKRRIIICVLGVYIAGFLVVPKRNTI